MGNRCVVLVMLVMLLPAIILADQSVMQRLVVRLEESAIESRQASADNCTFFKQIENVLSSTSEQLHNVTRGRLQWDRIAILVPKSAASPECFRFADQLQRRHNKINANSNNNNQQKMVIKNKRMDVSTADLVVHPGSHPLLSDSPYAQQYGGCGQSGLGVHLSRPFIRSFNADNAFLSSRLVLKEWVKHRYGVFDETGFDGDQQYPKWTSEYGSHPPAHNTTLDHQLRENSCTTFSNYTENVWPQEEEQRNGTLFDTESADELSLWLTTPSTPQKKNVKASASIMATLDAEDWCDGSTHIRWMPTKQNVLCQERSLWQVMESHPDFRRAPATLMTTTTAATSWTTDVADTADPIASHQDDSSWTTSSFFPPEFEYLVPSTGDRYVLVLDRSSSSRRWSLIRRALYRWIHALPDDRETHLSLVVSSDATPTVVLGWTKVTTENRDGLVGRIPRRPILSSQPSSQSSLASAVQLTHQMLADENEVTCCGGQLVLLTGSTIHMDVAVSDEVTVHTIAFPSRTAFIDLGPVDGLQLAVDDDEDVESETSVTQSRLAAAFLQILRYGTADTPTQVFEETVTSGHRSNGAGTFNLDAPLGHNVRVVAHCADEADLDTIEVVSPSGRVYDLPLVSDGMLHIRIPHTDEFGEWNYRLKFAQPVPSSQRHPMATSATLEVTAQPLTTSIYEEAITVRAWTNVGREPVNASITPILIYAEVKRGRSPVLDAKVTALIHPPNGGLDNTTHTPVVVQLYDRGTGDPDITRSDGIYSAYFTRAVNQPGHYAVTIQVTDNGRQASIPVRKPTGGVVSTACCGSSMPYEQTVPIQPFRRLISGPSFATVDGPSDEEDVYPPGRIADLRVERIINTTNEVELGWTAPGTDYDAGSAAFYQIRCYTDRSALNDSSSAILVHASLTPQPLPAGTWQKAMVAVPWPNQIFYYAIVAVDFSGLRGKVSNIVPVYIEEPPPPPTTTTQPPPLPAELPINVTRPEAAVQALTDQQMYAIAGGVAGFILLLIILSTAACLSRRKRSDSEEKPKSSSSSLKIQVEPLKIGSSHPSDSNHNQKEQEACGMKTMSTEESRPVYKIYVNNAYIQEEDGELKIVTPDGRIIQRGSPWFSSATLPRGRSLTNLEGLEAGTSANDLHHWSLPRTKTSPHRHKVLTNGSIMPTSGSQSVININNPSSSNGNGGGAIADGTSISSKPSVSSDDTGIEVSDHQADSRDSNDLQMILPPPGFGPIQQQQCNGYLPMYANHNLLPPLPPSPGMSQDARVVRIPSFLNTGENSGSWLGEFNDTNFCSQPSSRRPLMIGSYGAGGSEDRTPQISPPPPSTPTSQSSVVQHQPRRKTRHISFV